MKLKKNIVIAIILCLVMHVLCGYGIKIVSDAPPITESTEISFSGQTFEFPKKWEKDSSTATLSSYTCGYNTLVLSRMSYDETIFDQLNENTDSLINTITPEYLRHNIQCEDITSLSVNDCPAARINFSCEEDDGNKWYGANYVILDADANQTILMLVLHIEAGHEEFYEKLEENLTD